MSDTGLDWQIAFDTGYKIGEAMGKVDRPQGEWADKAISIIDDMQREGIVNYEQAWEFRMRARLKEANDE